MGDDDAKRGFITTPWGRIEVAIHKRVGQWHTRCIDDDDDVWSVTHEPSGCRVETWFLDQGEAEELLRIVAPFSFGFTDDVPGELKAQVKAFCMALRMADAWSFAREIGEDVAVPCD